MRLRNKLTSVLAVFMVLLLSMVLPVFAKTPKQPTGIPIPQYSTIPEAQYIPEPPQDELPDDGIVYQQWNAKVHTNIIKEGIAKVKRDKPWLAGSLTKQISLGNGYYTTPEKLLIAGINWPDSNETDGGTYKGHFFDPATGCNYLDEPVPTAYTRFNNHYVAAINATSEVTQWNELSYSLHYFGDLNAPHHAANSPMYLDGTTHASFEAFADDNYQSYTTNWTGDYFVANSTMLDIARYYSGNATEYIWAAKSSVDSEKRIAIDNTLPFAQCGAAGMIYRFFEEKY